MFNDVFNRMVDMESSFPDEADGYVLGSLSESDYLFFQGQTREADAMNFHETKYPYYNSENCAFVRRLQNRYRYKRGHTTLSIKKKPAVANC